LYILSKGKDEKNGRGSRLVPLSGKSGSRSKTYRCRYQIVSDILQIVANIGNLTVDRRHKTGIGYSANLSHKILVSYLEGLVKQGLLRISQGNGHYGYYEITPKGTRYLRVFTEIKDVLRSA
jgi:predicted transcriptional regulator